VVTFVPFLPANPNYPLTHLALVMIELEPLLLLQASPQHLPLILLKVELANAVVPRPNEGVDSIVSDKNHFVPVARLCFQVELAMIDAVLQRPFKLEWRLYGHGAGANQSAHITHLVDCVFPLTVGQSLINCPPLHFRDGLRSGTFKFYYCGFSTIFTFCVFCK